MYLKGTSTPFQKLQNLSEDLSSSLTKFRISIDLGQVFNHNRNPIAENLIKEGHKEINRAGYTNEQLDELKLTQALKNINSRVRE